MKRFRTTAAARWPFWLLIAAWFCANAPQAATLHVFLWLKGSGHFSHQAELAHRVAALLSGQTKTPRTAAVTTADSAAPDRSPPALPARALAKKIDLSLARSAAPCFARTLELPRRPFSPLADCILPPSPARDVPTPPPRLTA